MLRNAFGWNFLLNSLVTVSVLVMGNEIVGVHRISFNKVVVYKRKINLIEIFEEGE